MVWLGVLNYLLVSHHFAAQHFGLLSLYRARAGRASDAITRRLDRWFALVVGGGFVVLAEALAGSIAFQDRWIDPLLGAGWSDVLARTLRDGGIVFVVILTALILCVELRSQRPSPPRVAYVLGVSAMVLFAFLARDPFLFIVLWSVQHWSAAMGLASLAASGGAQAPRAHWQRLLAPINRRGWAVLLVLAVVSALLLPVMEVEAVSDEYAYADRLFGERRGGCAPRPSCRRCWPSASRPASSTTCLDRAAFRFSSPDVRQAARGLTAGVPMAVLVEAVSVIVRRDAIDRAYEGGWNAFVSAVPNATLCSDGEIARVGFTSTDEVESFVRLLEYRGLTFRQGGQAKDIAIVDQHRGPTTRCEWLDFGRIDYGADGRKVSACWLSEGPRIAAGIHMRGASMPLATPSGWTFQGSLSDRFTFVPAANE